MKRIILVLILVLVGGFLLLKPNSKVQPQLQNNQESTPQTSSADEFPQVSVVAENLDTPWAIAFLPNNKMLVTERVGRVKLVSDGKVEDIATLAQSKEIGEGGLMGIALHPDFSKNNFVYLYYTYSSEGDNTLNRVVKMIYKDNKLEGEQIIVDSIPGAANHNGGRIKFGPDKALYITTGDAQEPSLAQDRNSLAGKILRVTGDGKAEVYSYGHRNPQGIAWSSDGRLYETEHGPSGGSLGIGNDEVNQITMGKNYGWPEIQGDQTKEGMEKPIKHSGISTWAPAGAAMVGDKLFFGGLRGSALYLLDIKTGNFQEHFKNQFGRIREVILGPDNMLYITTSNKDGRGIPKGGDDKIIKINPQKL